MSEMAATSFSEEECFSVYWKVKNFSYCCEIIKSPYFSLYGDQCHLSLAQDFSKFKCYMYVPYSRCIETVQISLLTSDGSPEESLAGKPGESLEVSKDVIFGNRRDSFLPDDTLTVRLRVPTDSERGKLFICSQIGVKRKHILWKIANMSSSTYGMPKTLEKSDLYGDIRLHLKTTSDVNSTEQFSVQISRTGDKRCFCVLKISILDVDGKALNEVGDEFVLQVAKDQTFRGFPSIIKKSKWLEYKNLLLSDDILSLKCYFSISLGKVSGDGTSDISSCEYAAPLLKECEKLSMTFNQKYDRGSVTELPTDLKNILEDETLFDVSLLIGTEVIRAHKTILCARSPVFKAMFTKKDMKESINNTVVVEDVDVETVRELLHYMYTDSMRDQQWENVKKLYYVADKYQVLSLKRRCVSFLKRNLSVSNVCEALSLADLLQDADFKTTALNFILEYDVAVYASEAWKELEQNNPSFVNTCMREMYCFKRFN